MTLRELKLAPDIEKAFHAVVDKIMGAPAYECHTTDVIAEPENPGTIEVMVYGLYGTTLRCILEASGWVITHDERVWS